MDATKKIISRDPEVMSGELVFAGRAPYRSSSVSRARVAWWAGSHRSRDQEKVNARCRCAPSRQDLVSILGLKMKQDAPNGASCFTSEQ